MLASTVYRVCVMNPPRSWIPGVSRKTPKLHLVSYELHRVINLALGKSIARCARREHHLAWRDGVAMDV